MNGHHIWCNGNPNSPVETCKWCSGSKGLLAKYPEDCSPEELVKKHFPKVTARPEPKNDEKGKDDMSASGWKRPVNVDIDCGLRVMGWSKNSFRFTSDEGDGYEVIPEYSEGEGPTHKYNHFDEWAEQLSYAAEWCRKKAEELKAAHQESRTIPKGILGDLTSGITILHAEALPPKTMSVSSDIYEECKKFPRAKKGQ